ncbi:MAG: rhodanese-like domain-containing protein [Betaproteobacteria bacterium]|nr:MAG: rhodanese-like domain-containing protein [Betaproteobacteria bacterium]
MKTAAELIAQAEREIVSVTPEAVRAAMDDPNTAIIDIRDARELWREGKIPGAFHAPRGMNEFWIDPSCEYHKPIFSSGKRFIIYCAGAWRSALEAKMFQDMGLTNVAHMAGGFSEWKAAGLPVEPVERAPSK